MLYARRQSSRWYSRYVGHATPKVPRGVRLLSVLTDKTIGTEGVLLSLADTWPASRTGESTADRARLFAYGQALGNRTHVCLAGRLSARRRLRVYARHLPSLAADCQLDNMPQQTMDLLNPKRPGNMLVFSASTDL